MDIYQFIKIYHEPTDSLDRKVQWTLRKVEEKLPPRIYSRIYPTGSPPGYLYGTVKIYENDTGGKVD